MKIISALSRWKYLSALRQQMSASSDFGLERFTGFFAGSCFYVTHHCKYEWNRKITNQKNAAIGFVKDTERGCEVHFLCLKGLMCPLAFLFVAITTFPLVTLVAIRNRVMDLQQFWALYYIVLLCVAPFSALFESFTEGSRYGKEMLLSLLKEPTSNHNN
jgi:hypothetical protein